MRKKNIVISSVSRVQPGALALQKAAIECGHSAEIIVISEDDAADKINQADLALFRVSPRTYSLYATLTGALHAAPRATVEAMLNGFNKAATYRLLTAQSVPTPESYIVGRHELPEQYPSVVKIFHGSQGVGVGLMHDDSDYQQFMSQYPDEKEFLAQEFIAEAAAADKRLLVVGERVVAAMVRRSVTDDFRANLGIGGVAEPYVPTAEEVRLAVRATKALALPYAGVDIIESQRGPLVLEVNSSPGFAISDITGVNVPMEIIRGVVGND